MADATPVFPLGRISLARTSRYRTTPMYPDLDNAFGRWDFSPAVLPTDPTDNYHVVQNGEEFRLDVIAWKVYNSARLWWVIGLANSIRNPFTEPVPGALLRIPTLDRILSTVLRV